jgi:Ca2+-dependent lipid-binding protein
MVVLGGLINLLGQRAREIREFILLPWQEKKKKAREFWQKYGRLYIILFILAAVVAFINVYMETRHPGSLAKLRKSSLIGGDGTEKNKAIPESSSSNSETSAKVATTTAEAANSKKTDQPTVNAKPGTNQKPATNGKTDDKTSKPSTSTDTNNSSDSTTNNKQTKQNITVSTEVITAAPSANKSSKVEEIRERRRAKAAERASKTSIQESLSSLGNNLTAGISGGTGKALSVLGTFFSAILGLLLFCCAPVVIFYLWMKKLIMPLFPTSRQD